jgi:hypothetical protein
MLAQWIDFMTLLPGASEAADFVVASYEHASAADVTSIVVPQLIATQRRRQNQLR